MSDSCSSASSSQRPTKKKEGRLPRGQRGWRKVTSFCCVLLPFWKQANQLLMRLHDTSGCSHGPRVPDITEQYYGIQLPTARGERAGVAQEPFFVGAVVVRETCRCSTSLKPSHGLSPLGWQ